MPRVTAAVVSFQTRDLLARCLTSLDGVGAVCVVDNGSTDGSVELVRERFPEVRLDVPGTNLGFGAAVNRVADAAGDWDWLAVANADTALEPGALDALLAAGAADPAAGALAPRLVLPDGSTQFSVRPFWSPGFALWFNLRRQRWQPSWGAAHGLEGAWSADAGSGHVPWALGAFLLIRREAWEQSGGFDERQWLYAEDLDLGWRLAAAGWATRYVPEARVLHTESASTGALWGDARTERWMAASYDWMLRRRGLVRTVSVAAINVAGAVVRGEREWARLHATGLQPRRVRPPSP